MARTHRPGTSTDLAPFRSVSERLLGETLSPWTVWPAEERQDIVVDTFEDGVLALELPTRCDGDHREIEIQGEGRRQPPALPVHTPPDRPRPGSRPRSRLERCSEAI